jgi:hypothetical protein
LYFLHHKNLHLTARPDPVLLLLLLLLLPCQVPKVTSLLPNLTFVPSLLVPSSSSSSNEGPSISVTLPKVTLDQIATPNFMKTVQNMLSNVKGRAGSSEQVSVSLAPAAAAPARDTASTTTTVVTTTTTTAAPAAAATATAAPADTTGAAAPAGDDDDMMPDAATAATTATVALTPEPAPAAAAATTQPSAAAAGATTPPAEEPVVTEAPPGAALGPVPGSQEVTAGTPKPESALVADFALDADGEGSSVLPAGLVAGPQTAFMDPKDWAKLDKATQQEFLAIFNP